MLKEIAEQVADEIREEMRTTHDVKMYANELSSKEDIEQLAIRSRAIPNILVNIGPFDVTGTDSDMRADDLTIPIDIIIVVSNPRSMVEQKDLAFMSALKVQKILKGHMVGTSITSDGYIDGGTMTEMFAFKGFAAYNMAFYVNLSVDIDEI